MVRCIALVATMLASTIAYAQRTELPMRQLDLPNGDRRFATTLTIDGRPVDVGIDTGLTGMRLLPRGLSGSSDADKGPHVTYSYGAATVFEGHAITVPVIAGTISGLVRVMRVTAVGCTSARPDCPVAHMDLSA